MYNNIYETKNERMDVVMGIASLILGIISLITGWIPFICFFALILAVIGLILGIVDTFKKGKANQKGRGISIAGLVVSAVAIPIVVVMSLISMIITVAIIDEGDFCGYDVNYNYHEDADYRNDLELDDWYDNWYKNYQNRLNDYNVL